MPNSINYAERYQTELDQAFVQNMLTSGLETPNVNWVGAQTFFVPNLVVSGYQPHTRNGGYNKGSVTTTNEPYTLQFDRDIEFFVDQMDVDESNFAATAANVTREFIQRHSGPEIDAYRFSKLATSASSLGASITEIITADNVVTSLKRDLKNIRKFGVGNLIAYVSSDVMDAIELYKDGKGQIELLNPGTAIETRVTSLDGLRLIEVFDVDRFQTAFDFSDDFTPADGASQLNWIIVYRGAIIAKAKLSSIYFFAPGDHTEGDGYLYQNRLYHDLFLLKHQQDGLKVSVQGSEE